MTYKYLSNCIFRTFEPAEKEYVDPLLFCRRCSILHWEVSVVRFFLNKLLLNQDSFAVDTLMKR